MSSSTTAARRAITTSRTPSRKGDRHKDQEDVKYTIYDMKISDITSYTTQLI